MGFKSLIDGLVASAMPILGTDADGLAPPGTYAVHEGEVYNTTTRANVITRRLIEAVPMVRARLAPSETPDGVVMMTDRKFLIAALDLPGVTPKVQDQIIDADGTYDVKRLMTPPGSSLWVIHARKL